MVIPARLSGQTARKWASSALVFAAGSGKGRCASSLRRPFGTQLHSVDPAMSAFRQTVNKQSRSVLSRPFHLHASRCAYASEQLMDAEITGNGAPPNAVFVDYTIYKTSGALSFKPIRPQFRTLERGGVTLSREGSVFLTFAPSVGTRQYDWTNKQMFSLSVSEIGQLVALAPGDSLQFVHDPNKGKTNEGRVLKTLKVSPFKDNASGYFFNIAVRNDQDFGSAGFQLSVPVQKAEFAVMRNAMNYIMPYLMGWHVFVDPTRLSSAVMARNSDYPPMATSQAEWQS